MTFIVGVKSYMEVSNETSDISSARKEMTKTAPLTVGANGLPLDVLGSVSLEVNLDSISASHVFIVAMKLTVDCLLGIDFLSKHGAVLDCARNTLSFHCNTGKGGMEVVLPTHEEGVFVVSIAETVHVPARSGMIVKGKVECSGLLTGRESFIEPNCKDTTCRGFLIARSVNTVQSAIEVAIQITNIAPREVILYQGSQVADFYVGHRVMQIDSRSCESRQSNERPSVDLTGTDLTQSQKQKLENLIWEFRSLFVTEGGPTGRTSNVKHAIITNGLPVREPIRRIPHALQETVKLEVKKMLKDGVIRESNSPWSSPIVMIKKKDGSWRFCVDFRKVNSMTQKDAYPLPRIDEALEALTGSQFFTTLDLASGYWQVEMEEADRKKTAFSTREGHFEFNVMPFGLTNAPATFQRLMECVLAGLTYEQCLIYLDDIVVFSVTFDQHLERLKMVFHHLAEAGLKLKPSKCHFAKSEIRYLGHIVLRQGIQADPDKTSAMISFPVPSDIKELRQFLGLTNYYRRFIKGYSSIAEPLHKLTRKTEGGFKWNSECQNAFQHLKHLLVSPPILAYPQFQLPFVVASDASGCAIGAVLSQEHEGEEKVIAYWSRQLSKAEQNYSTIEREALAVVALLKSFSHTCMESHSIYSQTIIPLLHFVD